MLGLRQSLAVRYQEPLQLAYLHHSLTDQPGLLGMDVHRKSRAHRRPPAIFHRSHCAVGAAQHIESVPDVHYQDEQRREDIKCEVELCGDSGVLPFIVSFGLFSETKKVIWSFIGLIFTVLAVAQTLLQSFYMSRNGKVYKCEANSFRYLLWKICRYYFDIAAYSYIGLNILVFLIVKVGYLLSAWVCCPGVYLRIKRIID
jgi:hypothetical protein